MNKKKLRLAVWGIGQHAVKNVIPSIAQSSDVLLAGVYTRNKEMLLAIAAKYNCQYWETEEMLLKDPDVDAIFLTTPIGLHFDQGYKILSSGKHLLCEKSLTHDPHLSLKLIEYANQNQLIVIENFSYQFQAQFLALKSFVLNENFGKIIHIISSFGIPKLEKPGYRNFIELGGGAFWDVACYPISLCNNLLFGGELPIVLHASKQTCDRYHIDKSGTALLKFQGNVKAYLNWGYDVSYKNDVFIWGEKQSVYANFIFSDDLKKKKTMVYYDERGVSTSQVTEYRDGFSNMLSHFCEAIFSGRNDHKQIEQQALLMKAVLEN